MNVRVRERLIGLLFLATVSNCALATDQIPSDRTITRIHTYSTYAVVRFSPAFSSTLGCTGIPNLVNNSVVIDFSVNKDVKAQYAMMIGAFLSGKKVGFGVNACSPLFGFGVPKAYRVDVQ